MTKQVIRTDAAPGPFQGAPYSQAIRAGDLVFVSGQVPARLPSGEIAGETIEEQTEQVLENLKAILEEAGSSLEKVLDVTVYLTDMKRDFERFNRTYAETLGKVQPTRTTVGVDSLPTPILVELKVIASA